MEEEHRASELTCPFFAPEPGGSISGTHLASHSDARRCRGHKCAVWLGSAEEGRCAFVAIAEALTHTAPAPA